MNTDSFIADYLTYLDYMCGFAQRTINKYKRVCTLWEEFLTKSEHNDILHATPAHLLAFINYRQNVGKIKNACIFGELCVLRTFYSYLFDFHTISSNPAAALPKLVCNHLPRKSI